MCAALLNVADRGGSIVAPPQLYGTTHTLLAHTLRRHGVEARFAASDRPQDIAALIDDTTRAVFCETVGNPAGNICDIEAIAKVAHDVGRSADRRQYRGDAHPDAPDRVRRRHRRAFADQVHGRPRRRDGRRDRRFRPFRLARRRASASPCSSSPTNPITASSMSTASATKAYIARARSVYLRTTGAVLAPMNAFLILARHRDAAAARRAPCRQCAARRLSRCATIRALPGSNMRASRIIAIMRSPTNIWTGGRRRC